MDQFDNIKDMVDQLESQLHDFIDNDKEYSTAFHEGLENFFIELRKFRRWLK